MPENADTDARTCPNCGTEMRFDPGVSGGGAWYCPEYVGAIAPGGRFKCVPHNGAMTEKWEEGCDHHCGCVFVLLALADKLAEALRRHAHGGTDCGLCDEALSEYEAAHIDG